MCSLWVHLPYPLGDLLAQVRAGPLQTRWCTFESCPQAHRLAADRAEDRLENTRGREQHSISVFLCSVDMTPPYLPLPHLMARAPAPNIWCPLYLHQQWDSPLGWPVLGEKRQKGEKTKQKWEYALKHNYGLGRQWLFSLRGLLRSYPLCPFPLLTGVCYLTGCALELLFSWC